MYIQQIVKKRVHYLHLRCRCAGAGLSPSGKIKHLCLMTDKTG